jgi:uncharacterized protein (DUF2126 family)
MKVEPKDHFINWQQDPFGNYLGRFVFNEKARQLRVEVDLVAEMTVINPFDFFLEPKAEQFPFTYEDGLKADLAPYLRVTEKGKKFEELVASFRGKKDQTTNYIVALNQELERLINYTIRMEPGVQSPEETLTKGSGSCRDSAWLLVQAARSLGLAARFVSGYLIQLVADEKPLDGPSGPPADFTDLHAWAEIFLPGAGWVGFDPTSGLAAGEGHIPLAATPEPTSAAPITGAVDKSEVEFEHHMSVERIYEDPRVTKPYDDDTWAQIVSVGEQIDERLKKNDVRLTVGGEPTFVSIDDMEGPEWNTEAVGPDKLRLSDELFRRLMSRFAPEGLAHFGQGKWYPGESLPRWALSCYWRKDGEPIWTHPDLIADSSTNYGHDAAQANVFINQFTERLGLPTETILPGYEDIAWYLLQEQKLPANLNLKTADLTEYEERRRLAKLLEQELNSVTGYTLPISKGRDGWGDEWVTSRWYLRQDDMFLIPGDSPMGYRLPLNALPQEPDDEHDPGEAADPTERKEKLPTRGDLQARLRQLLSGTGDPRMQQRLPEPDELEHNRERDLSIVRTALCVEPRNGIMRLFMPPVRRLEDYLELVAAAEATAVDLKMPLQIEGYAPPHDSRLQNFKVTPDPGVIEVNVQPASDWSELTDIVETVYSEARQTRLGTEKFQLDGRHTGTGGGNHVVLGGPTPNDSPFLRRPDLLRSLVSYWNNHPALSYLFSGLFIGPTSQSPRLDEARHEALHEIDIAFAEMQRQGPDCPPWTVDRLLRNLLTDLTGNTHRAEFCIDKLYSPDSSSGRLGLVELRALEMPPHYRMSLAQHLLLRTLVNRFWEQPYTAKPVRWGTRLHDQFMLPHYIWRDLEDIIDETQAAGFPLETEWFRTHYEFRFPRLGEMAQRDLHVEIRRALEPWNVLGEEPGGGGTARYVDSSVERVQVKVQGLVDQRHVVACNGQAIPLRPTGTQGEYVAGVRFRAWQPPHCLHPTIGVHGPLVFDVIDTWNKRSVGGCTYHVSHPGGRGYDVFPVNAHEAESRRMNRFFVMGHTPGPLDPATPTVDAEFPSTLDLRRG